MNAEIEKILEKLPGGLSVEIVKILNKFALWIELAGMLPLRFRKKFGNSFLHAIVKAVKMFDLDSLVARRFCLEQTVDLFDLPQDWEPDWLNEPLGFEDAEAGSVGGDTGTAESPPGDSED